MEIPYSWNNQSVWQTFHCCDIIVCDKLPAHTMAIPHLQPNLGVHKYKMAKVLNKAFSRKFLTNIPNTVKPTYNKINR